MSSEQPEAQRFTDIVAGIEDNLWVLEGQIDLPIVLPQVEGKPAASGISLDFSGGTGDGYIELRAGDLARVQESVWWSKNEPVLFDFRASVVARGLLGAWNRAVTFLEQALDRLTFLCGAPANLVSIRILYNETQLEASRRGERTHVDCAPGGIATRNTQPIRNAQLVPLLQPSERCKRALRWFRKGMLSEDPDDRFLAFYVALECVSDDIQETEQKTHICPKCGRDTGIGKAHTDGIKRVVARHAGLPSDTFQILGRARARLVHDGKSAASWILASPDSPQTFPLVTMLERLAAEAITISLKADPDTVEITDTTSPNMTVVAQFQYTAEDDPSKRWLRPVREAIAQFRSAASQPPPTA